MAKRHRHILLPTVSVALLLAGCFVGVEPVFGAPPSATTVAVDEAWERWNSGFLRELAQTTEDPSLAALSLSAADFIDGNLKEAQERASTLPKDSPKWLKERQGRLLDTVASWIPVMERGAPVDTGDAGIILVCPPDEVSWCRAILPRIKGMKKEYSELLSLDPKRTLRIIFVATRRDLSAVSQVPINQLESSGTAAVTLFGTVFVLSPSFFEHGCLWLRILGHEMVHWYVHPLWMGRAPTFLEEGLAMLLEDVGLGEGIRGLESMERALLQLAHERNLLATQEDLLKPFWHFQSGLTARVAFLQSMLLVREVVRQLDGDPVATLVDSIADSEDWQKTLKELTRWSWKRLWSRARSRWRGESSREELTAFLFWDAREYLSDRQTKQIDEGRETVLLGDFLWGQSQNSAALRVYFRLPQVLQESPDVAWRIGRLLLELERVSEATERLDRALVLHPHDARLMYVAALCAEALQEREEARKLAEGSWLVYPFAKEIVTMLERLKVLPDPGEGDG